MTVKRPEVNEAYAYYFHVLQYAGCVTRSEFARLIGKKSDRVNAILVGLEERGYRVVENDNGSLYVDNTLAMPHLQPIE